MDPAHDSEIPVGEPCKLCGAPAGMTCSEYAYLQHVNSAFDKVFSAFTSPEELSVEDRMDRIGVPETVDREIELAEFATEREREECRS